jgi:hypothetical protein
MPRTRMNSEIGRSSTGTLDSGCRDRVDIVN